MTNVLYEGDDDRIELTLRRDGFPVPLDGISVTWALACSNREESLVEKTTGDGGLEIVDPDAGRLDIVLEAADTRDLGGRTYYQEIGITDADDELSTFEPGLLTIRPTVISEGDDA